MTFKPKKNIIFKNLDSYRKVPIKQCPWGYPYGIVSKAIACNTGNSYMNQCEPCLLHFISASCECPWKSSEDGYVVGSLANV